MVGVEHSLLREYAGALSLAYSLFRALVKPRTRRFRLRSYKAVFVGKEAVDALVQSQAVPSRAAAVSLCNALFQAGVFCHVTRDHVFKDKALFYRFRYAPHASPPGTPPHVDHPDSAGLPRSSSHPQLAGNRSSSSSSDPVFHIPPFEAEFDPVIACAGQEALAAEAHASLSSLFFPDPSPPPLENETDALPIMGVLHPFLNIPLFPDPDLLELWHEFTSAVAFLPRTISGQGTVSAVCSGREAVTALITKAVCSTRQEAVGLGQSLLRAGFLSHVTYASDFEDQDRLFFRSNVIGLGNTLRSWHARADALIAHYISQAEEMAASAQGEDPLVVDARDGGGVPLSQLDIDYCLLERQFRAGIVVHPKKRYMLRNYTNVFVGSEAVGWLMSWMRQSGYVPSVGVAVALGNNLLSRSVFHHVVHEHLFENEDLFYVFAARDPSTTTTTVRSTTVRSTTTSPDDEKAASDDASVADAGIRALYSTSGALDSPSSSSSSSSSSRTRFLCPRMECAGFAVPSLNRLSAHLHAMHPLSPSPSPESLRADFIAIRDISGGVFPVSGASSAIIVAVSNVSGTLSFSSSLPGTWDPPAVDVEPHAPIHSIFSIDDPDSTFSKGDLVASLILSIDPTQPESTSTLSPSSAIISTDLGSFHLVSHNPFV